MHHTHESGQVTTPLVSNLVVALSLSRRAERRLHDHVRPEQGHPKPQSRHLPFRDRAERESKVSRSAPFRWGQATLAPISRGRPRASSGSRSTYRASQLRFQHGVLSPRFVLLPVEPHGAPVPCRLQVRAPVPCRLASPRLPSSKTTLVKARGFLKQARAV